MNGGDAIRYLVIQPDGDIWLRTGTITAKRLTDTLAAARWHHLTFDAAAGCLVFVGEHGHGGCARNRLVERWSGIDDDIICGPVVVTGPADGAGIPTDAPAELAYAILRLKGAVEDERED